MINWLILISIGVVFAIIEIFTMSFVAIFIGLGFIVVGIISCFVDFAWHWQILLVFIVSLLSLFLLKKHIKKFINKDNDIIKDNFLDEEGKGVIKEGMIYFKGTLWKSDDIKNLKDGDVVDVIRIVDNNKLEIKK